MKKICLTAITALYLFACNDPATNAITASSDSANLSTNNSEEANEERNKQTALASARAFEAGNLDDVFKNFDANMVDYGEGSMKPLTNVDSAKAGLKIWMAAVPDFKGSDFMAVADGDYVMIYGTWTGTWKNELMGIKATGKSFNVKDVDIFKFNDAGKIIEHRGVQSNNEAARQLGMKMPTQ